MPGASHPFIDAWAPPQFVFGTGGSAGPERSPGSEDVNPNASSQSYDTLLHYKLAGTIIIALTTVFVLQQLGFRFVVAAGVGR